MDRIRSDPVRGELDGYTAAARERCRQLDSDLIESRETTLRTGIEYRNVDSRYGNLDISRARATNAGAIEDEEDLIGGDIPDGVKNEESEAVIAIDLLN
jgi:hypothetical protein